MKLSIIDRVRRFQMAAIETFQTDIKKLSAGTMYKKQTIRGASSNILYIIMF